MFTGIVETVGTLKALNKHGKGYEIVVETPASFELTKRVALGDSIANNGVCLTATKLSGNCFYADVSAETVEHTCFANYSRGQKLNLELACTPSTHLGGHIMQGHVDGVGEVIKKTTLDDAFDIWIKAPNDLLRYIAHKGSIAVDGVSLTVNEIVNDTFRLTLIPHTQGVVNFDNFEKGHKVNLEVDVLARYLERLFVSGKEDKNTKDGGLSMNTLLKNGFF
jgi:riboflavin synthase